MILTHTHGDHWKDVTLAQCRTRRIPVYAHPAQFDHLNAVAESFDSLHKANLTRTYTAGQILALAPGLTYRPVWVSHDADPTFAFRLDFDDGGTGPAWALGYASDLGVGSAELVTAFAGVESPPLRLAFSFTEGTVRRNTLARNERCEICGHAVHAADDESRAKTTAG